MLILFDHQTFSLQNYGGISRYFSELIKGIQQASGFTAQLPPLYSNNVYLPAGLAKPALPDFNFPKKVKLFYAINQGISRSYIKKQSFSIFHPTYYDPYFLPYVKGKPVVATFLDMIHEKFSVQYKELSHDSAIIHRKRLIAEKASVIIAISENTKKDIIDLYGINPDKIEVIYLGNSMTLNPTEAERKALDKPYLLFVGNRGFYKNFDRMLLAVAPLLVHYNVNLLCVGGGGFSVAERTTIKKLGVDTYVSQRNASDQELALLYKRAIAFLFPSVYEGFGIPVLEAFACECPCILSNSSSLPEIGGSAALYMNPDETDSIRTAVRMLLDNSDLRTDLIHKGSEQLKLFSWQKTVDETLQLYQRL